MITIGIVGGVGPESTIGYYRHMIAAGHTAIFINSVDVQYLLNRMLSDDRAAVTDYLVAAVERLTAAGADVAIIAANTPHIVFDEVQRRAAIPMVSIVEAVAEQVKALGLGTVGLLGTRFTMQGRFYPDVFARHGLSLVVPEAEDLAFVHDKYVNELLKNLFLPETKAALLAIVDRMVASRGVEAVILGGTELPLILREPAHRGVPLLDTTKIHADAVLRHARDRA